MSGKQLAGVVVGSYLGLTLAPLLGVTSVLAVDAATGSDGEVSRGEEIFGFAVMLASVALGGYLGYRVMR